MENHSNQVVKSAEVLGKKVLDSKMSELGKVEEIVFNKVTGETRYVVLSFGGFMGFGDKLYAIPWTSISYVPEEDGFILQVDKEKLKSAPGFDKNNWPNFADTTFIKSISDFYK